MGFREIGRERERPQEVMRERESKRENTGGQVMGGEGEREVWR